MKIAIASSGLGHVARGIETWAKDTAVALAERDMDVTLFAGGAPNVPLSAFRFPFVALPCWRRGERRTQTLRRVMPGFAWRWGLKDGYGIEQFTFWWKLEPQLASGDYDILHVQDPMLAYWCRRARRRGRVRTKEILAHGTEESAAFLSQFDYVQHLAPWHLAKAESGKQKAEKGAHPPSPKATADMPVSGHQARRTKHEAPSTKHGAPCRKHPHWVAIPNFVDTEVFKPAENVAERTRCREAFGIPPDAFVVGCAAAIKKHHKRIDYLISEFAGHLEHGSQKPQAKHETRSTKHQAPSTDPHPPFLAIAGASQVDTAELEHLGHDLCGYQVLFLRDLPRERMPDFYRALDVFVLPSLFEMMPIAVLEAMASGLPVIANAHPVLEWMTSAGSGEGASCESEATRPGGTCIDMERGGALSECLAGLSSSSIADWGAAARRRACCTFSREQVLNSYVDYYQQVMGCPGKTRDTE